jgi:glycosyltransferase involved in cell wall biosynthesis
MKIAFLTPEYPHEKTGKSGGIGTSIKNLAIALVAKGHVVIVLVYGQNSDEIFEDGGIVFYRIKNRKIKFLSWYFTRKKIEILINLLYSEKKIEIVEASDWTGITSFIQPKNCPVVIRENGSDTYFCHLDSRPVKWFNKFNEKKALQNADGIIAVSQFTGDLTDQLFGIKSNFAVIPNAINLDYFQVNEDFVVDKEAMILYFGSLIRKKGLLELPLIFNKVIEKNPLAKLILVGKDVPDIITGNGSTWEMMQTLFSPKALKHVHYIGSVPYNEVKQHIVEAKVCVFPSFAEALPVSWLEAMAMKKAIVASNIGWAKEMITDGVDGFLVNPKDHQVFADRILEILSDEVLKITLGQNARLKIETNFSSQIVADQSIEFYKNTIKIKEL